MLAQGGCRPMDEVCVDTVVEKVKTDLSGANIGGIGERLTGTRPVDAKAIQGLALKLGAQQLDVKWGHFEASIRYWRFHTDFAERLNSPHCKVADTYDHYRLYCMEPTVVAARRKHLALLAAAIHKSGLKSSTARALISMCILDNEGGAHWPRSRGRGSLR